MKVGILGSEGYIASFLKKRLAEESGIEHVVLYDKVRSDQVCYMDLSEPEKFDYEKLDGLDYLIFTAAVSGPDQCAGQYELCWKINVEGTEYVIAQALKRNIRVLFFSSDAVYGDDYDQIKDEESEKHPKTPYGKMKCHVEDAFVGSSDFKAIRLSYVVSQRDKFVSYCMECFKTKTEAEIFHPFYRSCITVHDVLDTVCWMLHHWEQYPHRFYNVAGTELVSRVRIADELIRICGAQIKYKIVTPGQEFFQNRPAITQMKSRYNEQYHIIESTSFSEKMKNEIRKEFCRNYE